MAVRRSLDGRLVAAALCACLLLAAPVAAQQPCLTQAHFAVNSFMECQLECASRGAAKGMGFSGTYKTYQSATGYMCCECSVARTASMVREMGPGHTLNCTHNVPYSVCLLARLPVSTVHRTR